MAACDSVWEANSCAPKSCGSIKARATHRPTRTVRLGCDPVDGIAVVRAGVDHCTGTVGHHQQGAIAASSRLPGGKRAPASSQRAPN